jgi:hypothetical protein
MAIVRKYLITLPNVLMSDARICARMQPENGAERAALESLSEHPHLKLLYNSIFNPPTFNAR